MGRFARLVLPRVSVLSGLFALVLVLQGLAFLRPPRWRSPVLAATEGGFLLAWLEGTDGLVPVRVQAFDRDLEPRGPARRYGRAPASALLSFWTRGDLVRLVVIRDRLAPGVPVGTFDDSGRRVDLDAVRASGGRIHSAVASGGRAGPRRDPPIERSLPESWPLRTDPTADGYRVTLDDPSNEWQPSSGGWSRDATRVAGIATVAYDSRGRLRALIERVRGGFRVQSSGGRLESAQCPPLATYGCVASAADEEGILVAWMRSRALGGELVLSRLGDQGQPMGELVLSREKNAPLVAAFAALMAILVLLIGHAAGRAFSAVGILRTLRSGAAEVWVDGRLDEPRPELVMDAGAPSWRMRTAAAWLNVPSGERVLLQSGTPYVVTLAALRGELPAKAAAVASFDRAYTAGVFMCPDEGGAYRGGATNTLRLALLSDAPLPLVRAVLRSTLACAILDGAVLAAVGLAAMIAIL